MGVRVSLVCGAREIAIHGPGGQAPGRPGRLLRSGAVRPAARASVPVSLLAFGAGCDGTEHVILIEAWPQDEAGLVRGSAVDVFVQDLRTGRVAHAPQSNLVDGLGEGEPI